MFLGSTPLKPGSRPPFLPRVLADCRPTCARFRIRFTFQFGKEGTHLEEKLPQRRRGVNLVGQQQEIDLALCQIIHDLDELER